MRLFLLSILFLFLFFCFSTVHASEVEAGALNISGMKELSKGNYERAEVFFKMALKRDPMQKHYYNNLAVSLMKMSRYDEAEKYLLVSISMEPDYTKALANMAVLLFHQRRYIESYRYYSRSKSSDPFYADERFKRERVERKLKDLSAENPDNEDIKGILEYLNKN
jgi:tetratricopeptide (TPR) repeat protein